MDSTNNKAYLGFLGLIFNAQTEVTKLIWLANDDGTFRNLLKAERAYTENNMEDYEYFAHQVEVIKKDNDAKNESIKTLFWMQKKLNEEAEEANRAFIEAKKVVDENNNTEYVENHMKCKKLAEEAAKAAKEVNEQVEIFKAADKIRIETRAKIEAEIRAKFDADKIA